MAGEEGRGATVGSLDIVLKSRTDQFEKDTKKAGEKVVGGLRGTFAKLDAGSIGRAFGSLSSPLDALGGLLGKLAPRAALVAGGLVAAGGAAAAWTVSTSKAVQGQARLADALGVSTSSVQRFEGAFRKVGGSGEAADSALRRLNDVLSDAKLGTEDAQARFEALGLSIDSLKGMGADKAFRAVLAEVAKLGTAAEQEAALTTIFGDQAGELVELTRKGVGGLNAVFGGVKTNTDKANDAYRHLAETTTNAWESSRQAVASYAQYLVLVVQAGVDLWNWTNKALLNVDAGAQEQEFKAQEARRKKARDEALKSAAELAKRAEANLAVQSELRAGERAILSFRRDRLKIEQEVDQSFKQASREQKDRLVAQKIDLARLEFAGRLKDAQIDILGVLDKEAGLRARIARDMQLATQEQRRQAFEAERARDAVQKTFDFRASTPGGADRLATRDLINARQRGQLDSKEYNALRLEQRNQLRENLGDYVSPRDRFAARSQVFRADRGLSDDDRSRGLENAQRQFQKDQSEFLASFGKITGPFTQLRLAATDIVAAVKQGALTKEEGRRALSDDYARLDAGPRMAESLDFGTEEFYKRIAMRIGGYEKKDPNQRVAENVERSNKFLSSIDRNLAKALQEEVISIK